LELYKRFKNIAKDYNEIKIQFIKYGRFLNVLTNDMNGDDSKILNQIENNNNKTGIINQSFENVCFNS
jgi:hypothetical protein